MEKQLHPKLRFPEFQGDWEKIKLGEITLKIGSGKTPLGGDKVYTTTGVPFIRSQNVNQDRLILDEIHIPETVHATMKSSKVKSNDILLNITGASIGRSCVVPKNFVEGNVNQHVCIIRLKNDNPSFIQRILSSSIGQKLIYQTQTGSGREGLNFESIKSFKLNLPSLPEQQKIADYLTTIDHKIELLQEKKTELTRYKKAMMQKLFSQEIRFKDENGNDYSEWEEKRIEQVFTITRGLVLAMNKLKNDPDITYKYPVYSSQTKDYGLTGYYKEFLYENAITWTTDGANAGTVVFRKGKFYCTNVCGVLISSEGSANVCIAEMINMIARKFVSYVGNPKLMNNVMAKIKINFPSVQEQQKIADFLSSIDESITKVEEQIKETQNFKKAMLQQLFV